MNIPGPFNERLYFLMDKLVNGGVVLKIFGSEEYLPGESFLKIEEFLVEIESIRRLGW